MELLLPTRQNQREGGLSFPTLICMNTNLITPQAVCHSNHEITKFQPVSTAHREKSFAASLSQASADVVTHADVGH